jgi:hypothetical protein
MDVFRLIAVRRSYARLDASLFLIDTTVKTHVTPAPGLEVCDHELTSADADA